MRWTSSSSWSGWDGAAAAAPTGRLARRRSRSVRSGASIMGCSAAKRQIWRAQSGSDCAASIRPNTSTPDSRTGTDDAPPVGGDERHEVQETVVLRAVAPPGSAEGPSGAHGGIGSSEPNWSQNVTNIEAAGRPPGVREGDGSSPAAPSDPDAEDTVKVTGAAPEAPRDECRVPGVVHQIHPTVLKVGKLIPPCRWFTPL